MNKKEEIIKTFFEDHEKYGKEVAYLKHMHPECVWVHNDDPEITGIDSVMAYIKRKNMVFQRPFAHIVIDVLVTDESKDNVLSVYTEFAFNKNNGDAFMEYYNSIFAIDEDGKITYKKDIYNEAAYICGDAVPNTTASVPQAYEEK